MKAEFQGTYTQLYQKTLAAMQGGGLPDTLVAAESQVADYARTGIVVTLDPYLNGRNGLSKANQDDIERPHLEASRYAQYGNRLLSFPFARSLQAFFVNDDLLRQLGETAPKTWADLERVAKRASRADSGPRRYGWMIGSNASSFYSWVLSRGGKLSSDDGKTVAWDGRDGSEALQLVRRCLDEQWCYAARGFEWQTLFGEGNLLFAQGATNGRAFLHAAVKSPLNWSVAPLPGPNAKARAVVNGGVFAVLRSTPEKQVAAWEFMKWFTDTKQTVRWSISSGYLPLRRSAASDADLQDAWRAADPQGRQAFDLVASSSPEPNVRGALDMRSIVEDMLTLVVTRRATPEEALHQGAQRANAVLKENE